MAALHGWLYKYLISSVSASSMLFFNWNLSFFPSKMLLCIVAECFELLYLEVYFTTMLTFNISEAIEVDLIPFKCF